MFIYRYSPNVQRVQQPDQRWKVISSNNSPKTVCPAVKPVQCHLSTSTKNKIIFSTFIHLSHVLFCHPDF